MTSLTGKPFAGPLRKLALAFDVGTTFSGVAYAVLDPGIVPRIQAVTRFPGQENGDFKIPSVLWYTQDGEIRAAGAEAKDPGMRLEAEDDELRFVEWFKLHLRPPLKDDGLRREDLPLLPAGKTVVDVFADFLSYLYRCVRTYIIETHPNGESLWSSFGDRIEVILSHPNGWEGLQQSQMRQAAILANLVPDTVSGHSRVHFVTEGEASLHYCVKNGLAANFIEDGATVMIIDAGGGTIDLSSYKFSKATPISVEEIAPAECLLQGSTRVNMRTYSFLHAKLRNSKYGNEEDLQTMLEQFEKSTKPTFKDPKDKSYIRFGSMRDKDPDFGIRGGQISIEGHEMADFFAPSISAIVNTIVKQKAAATETMTNAFLVGGYAASPWLYARLKQLLEGHGLSLSRPDNHTNKAVAEGAVSFYLQNFVSARVIRSTFGSRCITPYDHSDSEHLLRRYRCITRPSGEVCVPDAFSVILSKGTKVRESEEASGRFSMESENEKSLDSIFCDVICYRGKDPNPRWMDLEPEYFSTLCTIYADTSKVAKYRQRGKNGYFYRQNFKIVLSCGLTETKAQISWMEDGVEQRGPAKIVYDNEVSTA